MQNRSLRSKSKKRRELEAQMIRRKKSSQRIKSTMMRVKIRRMLNGLLQRQIGPKASIIRWTLDSLQISKRLYMR